MSNFSKRNIPSTKGLTKASVGNYAYPDTMHEPIMSLQDTLSTTEGRSRVRTLLSRGTSAPIEKKFRVTDVEKKFQQYGYKIVNRLFSKESIHPSHYLLSTKYGDEFILELDDSSPLFEGQVILSKEFPSLHMCKEEDTTYAAAETLCATHAFEDTEKKVTIGYLSKIDDTVVVSFDEDARGFVYPVMKESQMFPHVGDVIDITDKVSSKIDKVLCDLFDEIVETTDNIIIPEINEFVHQIHLLCEYVDLQNYITSDLHSLVERVQLLVEKEKKNKQISEIRKNLRYKNDVASLKELSIKEASMRQLLNNTIQEFYNLQLDEIIKMMKSGKEFVFTPPNISQFLENTKNLL